MQELSLYQNNENGNSNLAQEIHTLTLNNS